MRRRVGSMGDKGLVYNLLPPERYLLCQAIDHRVGPNGPQYECFGPRLEMAMSLRHGSIACRQACHVRSVC